MMTKKLSFIISSVFIIFLGCASTEKLELQGNSSVGDAYYSVVSPEGIVREVWHDYSIYLPFPGMYGKFKFKFEAISEGEAEIRIYNNFRESKIWRVATYKAVVDKNKKLTITKIPSPEEMTEEDIAQIKKKFGSSCDISDYKTVDINGQIWLAENWNCDIKGSRCYNNKPANCKYGRFYDLETAKTACPEGWHLPTDADWNALMKFINPNCSENSNCAGVATKLKAASGWNIGSGYKAGTDDYGFSALPNGSYINSYTTGNPPKYSSSFQDGDNKGYWWSSGTDNISTNSYWYMTYSSEDAYYEYTDPNAMTIVGSVNDPSYSVRCIKDN